MKKIYKPILSWGVSAIVGLSLLGCAEDFSFVSNTLKNDVFTQLYSSSRYDFLWVFDNSVSMAPKRDYVKDNLVTFLNILNSRKAIDYQMAMTTTDFFSHQGTLVTDTGGNDVVLSSSSDPVGDFAAIIDNVQNTPTSFWEQGLESAYKAIQNHSAKFMRNDVPLVMIFLTDEEDYSCQSNCFGSEPENNTNWVAWPEDRYTDYFQNATAVFNSEAILFPIVGTSASNCSIPSLGQRYMDVQDEIGSGQSGSICLSDLPTSYNNIAQIVADRGVKFTLSSTAQLNGMIVLVDGNPVPFSSTDGYIFEVSSNSIIFTGNSVPPNGSTIEVLYEVSEN